MYIVIYNAHRGPRGGGEHYVHSIALSLARLGHRVELVSKASMDMKRYLGFSADFLLWDRRTQPDIWISADTFDIAPPVGKKNILLVLFPIKNIAEKKLSLTTEYNFAICISDFAAEWTKAYWDMSVKVVNPCINIEHFQNPVRDQTKYHWVINVGHFFEEPNGHSKNQHILVEAFRNWKYNKSFSLYLTGCAETDSDMMYLERCKRLAKGLNVKFGTDISYKNLIQRYTKSRFYWQASGYNRTDPCEMERFGIAVVEAMAAGAIPLVHNSGNAKDFMPEFTWNEPEELLEKTSKLIEGSDEVKVREEVMRKAQKYSLKAMETELERIFGREAVR